MAALAGIVRERRNQLRLLRTAIIRTEAGFKAVRREADRLLNRKQSLPDAEDLAKLVEKMRAADQVFDQVTASVAQMAGTWR